jgi:hypothetical protein
MIAIEGHAIVSADGMIAAADGTMPDALRNEADWRLFQAALNRAALVVVGRLGHERHPNPGRRRLVMTSGVADAAPDPADPLATLWNPAGMAFGPMLDRLGVSSGTIAVTGGTRVFDYFLTRFTSFALSEVNPFVMPGGRSAFAGGHPRAVLAAAGLVPASVNQLDADVSLTYWVRRDDLPNAADGLRLIAANLLDEGQATAIRDIADSLCDGTATAQIEAGNGEGGASSSGSTSSSSGDASSSGDTSTSTSGGPPPGLTGDNSSSGTPTGSSTGGPTRGGNT